MLSDTGCNKTMSSAACGVFSATFTHITLVGVEVGQFVCSLKYFLLKDVYVYHLFPVMLYQAVS